MSEAKKCVPVCEFFKCGQRALQARSNTVYCRFVDDVCEGPTCKYALCVRNRLLSSGYCGLTLKRTTKLIDIPPEETVKGVKVKGRLQKRLREKELY